VYLARSVVVAHIDIAHGDKLRADCRRCDGATLSRYGKRRVLLRLAGAGRRDIYHRRVASFQLSARAPSYT